jgi:hypothetical protein
LLPHCLEQWFLKEFEPMRQRCVAAILSTVVLISAAHSQTLPARTYRFVSEWKIPAQHLAAYTSELEKNVRPVLEKLMRDGTIFDFGVYTTIVKEDEGITHGYWFEIPTLPSLSTALNALSNLPPSAIANSASKQHDFLFRILLRESRAGSGKNGIFYLNSTLLQLGKRDEWREWWDKYQKPMYDQFLGDGLITSYEIDTGEVHTMDPGWVYLAYVSPDLAAVDKINNAFRIRVEKRAAEENQAINSALQAIAVAGSHRDYMAQANSYATK